MGESQTARSSSAEKIITYGNFTQRDNRERNEEGKMCLCDQRNNYFKLSETLI